MEVLDRAKAALAKSKIPDLRRLSIGQDRDRIVVRGRLSSFYHLQLAQKQIRSELGDAHIVCDVQVL
jgi:hypothetical protein